MKYYLEMKVLYNEIVDMIAEHQDNLCKKNYQMSYEKKAIITEKSEASRLITNKIIAMICHSDTKLIEGKLNDSWGEKVKEIVETFVNPLIKTSGGFQLPKIRSNSIEQILERKHKVLMDLEAEQDLSGRQKIKLKVINLVANLCRKIARSMRKIRGKESFADRFESAVDKAAKELRAEMEAAKKPRKQAMNQPVEGKQSNSKSAL